MKLLLGFSLLFVFCWNAHSFRLPASTTKHIDKKEPVGGNPNLLNSTHAEEVILRVEDGELDVYLDLKKTSINLKGKPVKLTAMLKLPSNSKIKITLDGKKKNFRKFLREKIVEQTSYLYGILQSPGYAEALDIKKGESTGVLGENHVVGGIHIKKVLKTKIVVGYKYYYTKALVSKDVLRSGGKKRGTLETEIETHLPSTTKESKIYHQGCTDETYTGFGDYWYFYDPYKHSCYDWMEKKRRTVKVDVKFRKPKHYERAVTHFPEYQKIFKDNIVKIMVIIGYNNHAHWKGEDGEITQQSVQGKLDILEKLSKSKDSLQKINKFLKNEEDEGKKSNLDVGMENWGDMKKILKSLKFKKLEEQKWFSLAYNHIEERKNLPGLNRFARFEKELPDGRWAQLDMVAVDTDINSPDATFAIYWKKAMEEYEVISYNGHSGLGANLDIDSINLRLNEVGEAPIKFNPNMYQLIFFNGCSTYAYYNKKYFKAKKGSSNFETMLTGLPSYYSDMGGNNKAFLKPFVNLELISYPELVGNIEKTNKTTGTTLLFVNGEQDNPKTVPEL